MLVTTVTSPQSKFQLVVSPALPAKCIACGRDHRGQGEEFVDFNVSIEEVTNSYGAVLFCLDCVMEMVLLLPRDESLIVELAETSSALELERNRVRILLDALPVFNIAVPDGVLLDSVSDSPEPEDPEGGKSIFARTGD